MVGRVETRLDAAGNGHPAMLRDDSKHNRWANSRALELAGVGPDTPDPAGGEILRDPQGRATGILIEAGGVLIERAWARTRSDPSGRFPGTLWPEEAVTLDEAIAIYTKASARAMGLSSVCGSLEAGKSADFVVLDADPCAVDLADLPRIQALQTWFAGEKVYQR